MQLYYNQDATVDVGDGDTEVRVDRTRMRRSYTYTHVICRHRICLSAISCSGQVTSLYMRKGFLLCQAALCHSSFEGHGFFKLRDYVTA